MNAGKRFEGKFHESIKHLPGASMRIEDGGKYAFTRQWGDFFFFADSGDTFLFECKATQRPSFEHRKIADHQIETLKRFNDSHKLRHGIIALNFYGENIREKNDCILIGIDTYLEHLESTDRESLSQEEALGIGVLMPRVQGNIWHVDPWAVV